MYLAHPWLFVLLALLIVLIIGLIATLIEIDQMRHWSNARADAERDRNDFLAKSLNEKMNPTGDDGLKLAMFVLQHGNASMIGDAKLWMWLDELRRFRETNNSGQALETTYVTPANGEVQDTEKPPFRLSARDQAERFHSTRHCTQCGATTWTGQVPMWAAGGWHHPVCPIALAAQEKKP